MLPAMLPKTKQVYREQEDEKKRKYNVRIINVERGTFTPLVFSTFGGMGKEGEAFHRRLAQLIADKRNEKYAHVMGFIRTKLRFAILKSILIAIRGIRGRSNSGELNISQISFNMIPGSLSE